MRAAGRTLTLDELLGEIAPGDRPELIAVTAVDTRTGKTLTVHSIEIDRDALRPALMVNFRSDEVA